MEPTYSNGFNKRRKPSFSWEWTFRQLYDTHIRLTPPVLSRDCRAHAMLPLVEVITLTVHMPRNFLRLCFNMHID